MRWPISQPCRKRQGIITQHAKPKQRWRVVIGCLARWLKMGISAKRPPQRLPQSHYPIVIKQGLIAPLPRISQNKCDVSSSRNMAPMGYMVGGSRFVQPSTHAYKRLPNVRCEKVLKPWINAKAGAVRLVRWTPPKT